jgi:hypothetical protein
MPHSKKTESESRAAIASEACLLLTLPRCQRDRNPVPRPGRQIKVGIANLEVVASPSPAVTMTVTAMKDRRRDPRAPLSKSLPTPQPEIFKAGSATQQQQQHQTQPSCTSYYASHTKTNNTAATNIVPSVTSADASTLPHQHLAPAGSITAVVRSRRAASSRGYAALGLCISACAPNRAQTEAYIWHQTHRCTRRAAVCDQSPMVVVVVP